MSFGTPGQGNHASSLGVEDSRPFIRRALEAGINFFDTANRYSLGSSEEILGRALKDFARRDGVVIAIKVYGRMRPGPNGAGLSRRAIMSELDVSTEEFPRVMVTNAPSPMRVIEALVALVRPSGTIDVMSSARPG
ncbi:MAG TPA: aldo/keto reductase [Acetobacteraceae bacterium]|jgi:aryl-alcohol dehydrogenase-like predicted oxidoreductase|nr:aldo/keto reductase [Acetobacteraceae bacterium]